MIQKNYLKIILIWIKLQKEIHFIQIIKKRILNPIIKFHSDIKKMSKVILTNKI